MTTVRAFRASDLFKLSLTNLDPLTENYDLSFYHSYMAAWPDMFQVAEDMEGNIVGYIMGKVEEDPSYLALAHSANNSVNYLPWHGHVTALTVAPCARRQGLAKTLTAALEAACEEENAWFVDLFVREANNAVGMYKGMGYSVFRRVVDYYSDDPTGRRSGGEDAFDMRKPLSRDVRREWVRENGEEFRVTPEELYGG